MVYGYVPTPEVGQLSRIVREREAGPDDAAPEVNLWAGDADEEPHPLVLELNDHEKDAVSAALAYMAEGSETDAPALIRWMMDGAYKGYFVSEEAFARDQFADAFADHIEGWDKRGDIGFPLDLDIVEAVDWGYIGYEIANGDTWYFVPDAGGVYVFDLSIDIDEYRGED
jgi:hypothetical protein